MTATIGGQYLVWVKMVGNSKPIPKLCNAIVLSPPYFFKVFTIWCKSNVLSTAFLNLGACGSHFEIMKLQNAAIVFSCSKHMDIIITTISGIIMLKWTKLFGEKNLFWLSFWIFGIWESFWIVKIYTAYKFPELCYRSRALKSTV